MPKKKVAKATPSNKDCSIKKAKLNQEEAAGDGLLTELHTEENLESIAIADSADDEAQGYTPIKDLNINSRHWVMKVVVTRLGTKAPYNNKNGSGTSWKLIFMDDEGTLLGAILFNTVIERLDNKFLKGETYYVTNGQIKAVDPQYKSPNGKIELRLTEQTMVEIANPKIALESFPFKFIPFEKIQSHPYRYSLIDVFGIVGKVGILTQVHCKTDGVLIDKRDITIHNNRSVALLVTLWGDLATNEGQELRQITTKNNTVALANVEISTFGSAYLKTTVASILLINPTLTNPEIGDQSDKDGDVPPINDRGLSPRWKDAQQVGIKELMSIENRNLKVKTCFFIATIKTFDNPNKMWYTACSICTRKISPTDDGGACRTCNLTEPRARFIIKLTVEDDNSGLSATLFDAGEKFFGCTATEYNTLDTIDAEMKRASAIGKTYKFYTDLTKANDDARRQGRVIVEDVEETQNTTASKGSSSTTQEIPILQNIKKEK